MLIYGNEKWYKLNYRSILQNVAHLKTRLVENFAEIVGHGTIDFLEVV